MNQAAPRVLVVDDERHVRGMLCDLLTAWGCRAEEAVDATEGLMLLKRGGYDLVLTDYLMPGATGLQLIETVRNGGAQVGVIMLTASPKDLAAECRRLNFRVLRKPLDIAGLQAAVKEALAAASPAHDGR